MLVMDMYHADYNLSMSAGFLSKHFEDILTCMIKRIGKKYVVRGEKKTKSGKVRKFGTYKTLAEAKERLRQVEFFKHRGGK